MLKEKTKPGKRATPEKPSHIHILGWLADDNHDLISVHKLEKKAKMPRGSLDRAIKGKGKLSVKYYMPLVKILNAYGYISTDTNIVRKST